MEDVRFVDVEAVGRHRQVHAKRQVLSLGQVARAQGLYVNEEAQGFSVA